MFSTLKFAAKDIEYILNYNMLNESLDNILENIE